MMKGHRHDRCHMRQLDGEHLDLVQLKLPGNELVEGLRQREFAQADLDRDLLQTGHAAPAAVRWRLNQRLRLAAEAGITGDEPKEGVPVQQQVHFKYGSKSAKGASKSSAMLTNPRALPGSMRAGGLVDGSLASRSTSCNTAVCAESGSVLAFE